MHHWIVNVCPFLHFDNSRVNTYEHNISIASWNIKSVLDYLEISPDHKFCLDQVTMLEGFQRLFPNYWNDLQQRVLEGRIEIVGGTYVMPDFVIPDGESIVRQFLFGIQTIRREFGVDVKTGWALDSAGHCSQMPQILRLCGIDSYYFWRGMPFDAPSEFVWKGPDGSRVNAIWLPMGFEAAAWLSENTREAFVTILDLVNECTKRAVSSNLFIPVGGELVPPPPHLADIVNRWNSTFKDTRLVITTPGEYVDRIKSVQGNLPILTGPLIEGRFTGIRSGGLSGHIRLKLLNRRLEGLLYMLETFLSVSGENTDPVKIENIWKILLFNQDHNIIRGTCGDSPYQLALRRYKKGIEQAESLLDDTLDKIGRHITNDGRGVKIAVFNPLNWERSDVVRVRLEKEKLGAGAFAVKDPDDNDIMYQINESTDDDTKIELIFMAEGVPAVGYKTFTIVPVEEAPKFESEIRNGRNWVESKFYAIEFDEFSWSLSRILDKRGQFEAISDLANYITVENDVGDLYRYSRSELSSPERDIISTRISASADIIETGPVETVMRITKEVEGNTVEQTVTLYEKIPRIDMTTKIEFKGRSKRVRLNFPINVFAERVRVGAQFASEERITREVPVSWNDATNTFSALDWVLCSGPDFGVCLSAPGLHEFEFKDGLLRVTLLRSVDYLSRGLDDDPIEAKTAKEQGTFEYSYTLMTFKGAVKDAELWRGSMEHRLPLMARVIEAGEQSMPNAHAFLTVSEADVIISCIKPTTQPREYIIRLFEPNGECANARVEFAQKLESVKLMDLTEREIGDLMFERNTTQLALDPHSIVTLKIKFVE